MRWAAPPLALGPHRTPVRLRLLDPPPRGDRHPRPLGVGERPLHRRCRHRPAFRRTRPPHDRAPAARRLSGRQRHRSRALRTPHMGKPIGGAFDQLRQNGAAEEACHVGRSQSARTCSCRPKTRAAGAQWAGITPVDDGNGGVGVVHTERRARCRSPRGGGSRRGPAQQCGAGRGRRRGPPHPRARACGRMCRDLPARGSGSAARLPRCSALANRERFVPVGSRRPATTMNC